MVDTTSTNTYDICSLMLIFCSYCCVAFLWPPTVVFVVELMRIMSMPRESERRLNYLKNLTCLRSSRLWLWFCAITVGTLLMYFPGVILACVYISITRFEVDFHESLWMWQVNLGGGGFVSACHTLSSVMIVTQAQANKVVLWKLHEQDVTSNG